MKTEKPRLLVTGVTGLLGSALVREGVSQYEIFGLARRPDAIPLPCPVIAVDLVDEGEVFRAIEVTRPDIVIHTAALTSVDQCESNPSKATAVNVDGTCNLLRALHGHSCRFVFISTDAVFDGTEGYYGEGDLPAPVNAYGRTKLEAETVVLKERPDALIVRTAFYGWNLLPKESLGEWILNKLRNGPPVPGFVDLKFSPLLADDLARLLFDLLRTSTKGVLHVGSCEGWSKFDFACRLATVFGFPPHRVVPTTQYQDHLGAPRPKDVSLSVARATGILGRNLPGIEDGLRQFLTSESSVKRAGLFRPGAQGDGP